MLQTTSRIQSSCTSLALEMFCLLMVDEDLEVVEIPLAVITPGPCEYLLDVRMLALPFTHGSSIEQIIQEAMGRYRRYTLGKLSSKGGRR